jgi:hypothetical protein
MQTLHTIKRVTRYAKNGDVGLWGASAAFCLLLLLIVFMMLQPVEIFSSSDFHIEFLAADSQALAESNANRDAAALNSYRPTVASGGSSHTAEVSGADVAP